MPIRDIWKIGIGSWIIEAFDIQRPKVVVDTIDRAGNPATLLQSTGIFAGKKRVQFGFSTYGKHLGSEGQNPVIADLLKAAGLTETKQDTDSDSTDDTFIYKTAAIGDASTFVDVKMMADTGYYIEINDAVVTQVRIIAKVGEPLIFAFTLVGTLVSEATSGTITGNYDTQDPFIVKEITLGSGVPQYFNAFELTIDNTVAERVDPSAAAGVLGHFITKQSIEGSIDPEFVIKHAAEELASFSILLGSTGDSIEIAGGKVLVKDMEPVEDNGLLRSNITLGFYDSASGANDALTITIVKKE